MKEELQMADVHCWLCGRDHKVPKGQEFLEERGCIEGFPGNVCPICRIGIKNTEKAVREKEEGEEISRRKKALAKRK